LAAGDYKRLSGSARNYVDQTTGEIVSYRQYRNAQATQAGFSSYSEYQRVLKNDRELQGALQTAVRFGDKAPDIHSSIMRHYGAVTQERKIYGKPSTRAGGALARFLVDLGLRDEDALYDVGDTPRHS
jgi:hypothetical protein